MRVLVELNAHHQTENVKSRNFVSINKFKQNKVHMTPAHEGKRRRLGWLVVFRILRRFSGISAIPQLGNRRLNEEARR